MKGWKKIAICVILGVTIPVTALAVWQRENLLAFYQSVTQDAEDLEQKLEEQQAQQHGKLEEQYQVTVKPPSTQHNNDLINGVITPEDVKDELGITEKLEGEGAAGTARPVQPEEKPTQKPAQSESKPEKEPAKSEEPPKEPEMTQEERIAKINDLVDRCTAELYACEVDLMAQMGEMKRLALSDWNYRDPKDKTKEKMIEFGFSWLDEVYEVEVVADRQVKAILANYKAPLEDLNADTSVLDDMWKYYCDKKASTKAYYLNKYLD